MCYIIIMLYAFSSVLMDDRQFDQGEKNMTSDIYYRWDFIRKLNHHLRSLLKSGCRAFYFQENNAKTITTQIKYK